MRRLMVANVQHADILNNPGSDSMSLTIWFAGCSMNCIGCHNPDLQDMSKGTEYSPKQIVNILQISSYKYKDVVLLGGEPLEQDMKLLIDLTMMLNDMGYRIWLYTGKDFDAVPRALLDNLHFVKAGRYIKELERRKGAFPATQNQKLYLKHNNGWMEVTYDESRGKFIKRI